MHVRRGIQLPPRGWTRPEMKEEGSQHQTAEMELAIPVRPHSSSCLPWRQHFAIMKSRTKDAIQTNFYPEFTDPRPEDGQRMLVSILPSWGLSPRGTLSLWLLSLARGVEMWWWVRERPNLCFPGLFGKPSVAGIWKESCPSFTMGTESWWRISCPWFRAWWLLPALPSAMARTYYKSWRWSLGW